MSGLADSLYADGSISSLEAAAPWRVRDAKVLRKEGRLTASAYLFGYAAEMRITASCFQIAGYDEHDRLGRAQRAEFERAARQLNLMTADPHDLAGWTRYLVYLRKREQGGYGRYFRDTLIGHVEGLYGNWRPRLRYRTIQPTKAQLDIIESAVNWLESNYTELWS